MKEIEISREKIKKIFKTYLTEKEGRQVNVSVDVNYRSHEPVINYFDETGTPKHLTQEEIRTILQ